MTNTPTEDVAATIDQIRRCEDVGADDFISKPQFAKLVDLLDKHCLAGNTA